jgi:A/G-specific adenine glycosylase
MLDEQCSMRGFKKYLSIWHLAFPTGEAECKTGAVQLTKIVTRLLGWFSANARDLPWRRTRDPYAVWVSEIMLQQTQVKTVVPYWERWMAALPTVKALAHAKPERLHKLWEGLGYYTRVRNMQRAAQAMLEKYRGEVPDSFEELLGLPGIGRYTAGAICSIAFNQPKPVVDGNVMRVLTRVFGIGGDPRDKKVNESLWQAAQKLVQTAAASPQSPATRHSPLATLQHPASSFNQALMELGALVCTPRLPRCEVCPLRKLCVAFQDGRVEELPAVKRRERATKRRFVALIFKKRDRFLVRQRPAGVVNAHLWEFPNFETGLNGCDIKQEARKSLGIAVGRMEPLCTINHTITRYRIKLDAFQAWSGRAVAQDGRWVKAADLKRLPFTSAHRKIVGWISGLVD